MIAIITPRIFPYIDDAKKVQAQGDVNQIAAAIQAMYRDTGRWPFYYDSRGALAYADGTDAQILTSNTACHGGVAATCDTNHPEDATAGDSWDLATAVADNVTNHMIRNRPFDLAGGPLFRAGLLQLAEEDHVLLLTIHHIVSDAWSGGVLWRELAQLYNAFLAGDPSPDRKSVV